MKTPATFLPIALALATMILAPRSAAQALDTQEGPREIEKCRTIDKPGSYKLVNNLSASGPTVDCLDITVSFVTIDLAGFTITGADTTAETGTAIKITVQDLQGITVRNGSISNFSSGVDLSLGEGSIVEGLRVFANNEGPLAPGGPRISAAGIVRNNTVVGTLFMPDVPGISASGIVTGNYVTNNRIGMEIGQSSTVIGNTVFNSLVGMVVGCPSNVTDNFVGNGLMLEGNGCNNTNNVTP